MIPVCIQLNVIIIIVGLDRCIHKQVGYEYEGEDYFWH